MINILILEIKEHIIKKLPYLTRSWKIFFTKNKRKVRGKEKFLYTKHGIGFTANLIELLEELRKGNFSMIWYNFGIGERVEIYVNETGELEGRYTAPYNSTLESFKKRVGII